MKINIKKKILSSATLMLAATIAVPALAAQAPAFTAPANGDGCFQSGGSYLFTMSNETGSNSVVVFKVNSPGDLSNVGAFDTGGEGTGAGLGNQSGILFNRCRNLLFVVNAGDNSISSMRLNDDGSLSLVDNTWAGTDMPISLALHNGLLYVVGAGNGTDGGNIAGFDVGRNGSLSLIDGSREPLSEPTPTGPAQIGFAGSGRFLVVTEKNTNRILTYAVNDDGSVNAPVVNDSNAETPFGFGTNDSRHVLVSDAIGGTGSALSSYYLNDDGTLTSVGEEVSPDQAAACWVALTPHIAYSTNTGTNSITSYYFDNHGNLKVLQAVAGSTGSKPIDLVVLNQGRLIYDLNSGDGTISAFHANGDGTLTSLGVVASGLSASVDGLVAGN